MPFDPRELVDPAFFRPGVDRAACSIDRRRIDARVTSEPVPGMSVEFASHREYAPGDDLRHLNWKLYARHDRLYIKEYDADTNLNLYLLVDASASMGCANAGRSKLHYAASLAELLVPHLAIKAARRGGPDPLRRSRAIAHLSPRSRANQLDEILGTLGNVKLSPASDTEKALHQAAELGSAHPQLLVKTRAWPSLSISLNMSVKVERPEFTAS